MQLGIHLRDVNASLTPEFQTMECRAQKAREEGFSCVHLALSKVIEGVSFNACAVNEDLAMYAKRVFHTQAALDTFVRGLSPVVECAENQGMRVLL